MKFFAKFFERRRLHRIAQRRALMNRAIDWLEANPKHHIDGTYATDANGFKVPPTSASAKNFCALGRIAREAGISGEYTTPPLRKFMADFGGGDAVRVITNINDGYYGGYRTMSERLGQIRKYINAPLEGETV
jgi:hypothetical protein